MKWFILCCLGLAVGGPVTGLAEDWFHAGPLYDRFGLTLEPGERMEAAGPFYYEDRRGTLETWAIPPFFSSARDSSVDSREYDFLYPILTFDRYGQQYRWQIGQLWSFAGGPSQDEPERHRFTLFPIYFQQRSSVPDQNYIAVFPFYGHLQHRLYRDDVTFITPFYIQSRKKDVVTDNYFYPFFHLRHGDKLTGWQFWPFVGEEKKGITGITNGFGDIQLVGGHDQLFLLWPIYYNEHNEIGTPNSEWRQAVLPFYALQRSPKRDVTTVFWPFFSSITDREKHYHSWQLPWPLVDVTRGPGKTINRFLPFYSHAHNASEESDSYMWPIFKHTHIRSPPLEAERHRVLFFLWSNTDLKNLETGKAQNRSYFWPFYTYARDFNGNSRLQILAPVEPVVPGNRSIERNYAPLWSVWRSERNPHAGTVSQSLLWNLYRRETGPGAKKCSFCFGLFQYQAEAERRQWRLFYLPIGGSDKKISGAFVPRRQDNPSLAQLGFDSLDDVRQKKN